MTHLNISLFGYPAIELDGAPIAVEERKALALLIYLAVSGIPQSREALGALLWPEHDQAQSYANLRHALWSLRRAGLAEWLKTGREAIALRAGYELDVASFQQAVQNRHFQRAAALYRADLLAGFTLRDAPAFDEWQFFQAEHLRQALAVALQQLVAEHRERGDYEGAIACVRRWLALDPLHEEAHRQLMQLYAWAGQHAAALRQYEECARLLGEELGSAPENETTALLETIRARQLVPPVAQSEHGAMPAAAGNLPHPLTSLVGREEEIAEVTRLLDSSRLVTLTGSGGCGKTRLALEVGHMLLAQYPQGVWFVDLAPLADPALVPQTVATALGLREEPGRPILTTLTDYLRARHTLLILDNCEHLIEASAQLAESVLRACLDIIILTTSRETLGVPGEAPFRVPSLSVPDSQQPPTAEELLQYDAVVLFVDRAAAVLPGFAQTDDNAAALTQVCRSLDGIPLAVELAAARVGVLRVEQIAARLGDTFRLLTGGSRTAPARQQTLRATIDWSYNLLSDQERVLLRRLSAFAGGWTLEAASAVMSSELRVLSYDLDNSELKTTPLSGGALWAEGQNLKLDILDGLTALVNKSLVLVKREQGREARYRLLETIRQYAHEKLLEADEEAGVRDHHLDYFMQLAEQAQPELTGPNQVAWINRLELELDNLRAALGWAVERDVEAGLRLASALWEFWEARGYARDGRDRLAQLLVRGEALGRAAGRAKALSIQSHLTMRLGDYDRARVLAAESLELYRELGDRRGIAFSLLALGQAAQQQDDYVVGQPAIMESLALYRELGDKLGIANVLGQLAFFAENLNFKKDYTENIDKSYVEAHGYLEESLAIYRQLGHLAGIGYCLHVLGTLTLWQGDLARARPWLEEGLAIHRRLGKGNTSHSLINLGQLALHERNYEQARAYLEEGLALSHETGQQVPGLWASIHLGYVALRQGNRAQARAVFAESQQQFYASGSKIGVACALEGLASLAVAQGQPERAVCIYAWADATREAIGDRRPPVEQADIDQDFTVIRSQLDEDTIVAAYAAGRAMTIEQAITYALVDQDVTPTGAIASDRLDGDDSAKLGLERGS